MGSNAPDELKKDFASWLYKSFIRKRRPDIELPDMNDFYEVHAVLANRVEEWNQAHFERGVDQGVSNTLQHLLHRKFGDLPNWAQQKLDSADAKQLEQWLDNILFADSLEKVFEAKHL